MPEVGETGWGQLVSNNFEIIDNAIGDGTRTITILPPNTDNLTITQKIFDDISYYDEDNILYANFGGNIILKTIYPYHSCRLMIIIVNGNAIVDGNIDTYPAILQIETPPNSPETNTYTNDINFVNFSSSNITVIYSSNENNSQITMNYSDYLNLIYNKIPTTSSNQSYTLSIPAATAAGGTGNSNTGTAGTADNTCNGGGGKGGDGTNGGTGCIFGQYECNLDILSDAYGYGSGASKKYRCGLIFIINGNLIINGTITQNGGNAYGNFSILALAYSGNDIPPEFERYAAVIPNDGENSYPFDPELMGLNSDEQIVTLEMNLDPRHVWADQGDDYVAKLAHQACLKQAPKNHRKFRDSYRVDVEDEGIYTMVPFWFVYFYYEGKSWNFMTEGSGSWNHLSAPQSAKIPLIRWSIVGFFVIIGFVLSQIQELNLGLGGLAIGVIGALLGYFGYNLFNRVKRIAGACRAFPESNFAKKHRS